MKVLLATITALTLGGNIALADDSSCTNKGTYSFATVEVQAKDIEGLKLVSSKDPDDIKAVYDYMSTLDPSIADIDFKTVHRVAAAVFSGTDITYGLFDADDCAIAVVGHTGGDGPKLPQA